MSRAVTSTTTLTAPRNPAQADKRPTLVKLEARSREWEIALAIAGMILFAVAMNLLWLGLNSYIFK